MSMIAWDNTQYDRVFFSFRIKVSQSHQFLRSRNSALYFLHFFCEFSLYMYLDYWVLANTVSDPKITVGQCGP